MHMETVLESTDIETVVAARVGDTLGYARVSTNDQNLDAQRARLIEAGAIGPCVREERCTVIRSPLRGGSERSLRHRR